MVAAVLALFAAVIVTVAYRVLTEQLDYASVRRRQLDVWAAVAAIACFGVIMYGNATTPRIHMPSPIGEPGEPADVEPVRRITPPTVAAPQQPVQAPGDLPSAERAPEVVEPLVAEGPAVPPDREFVADPTGAARTTIETIQISPATSTATTPHLAAATLVPSPTARVSAPRIVTPRPTVQQPPTASPTEQPPPAPSATPHCGDPSDIRIVVSNMKTRRTDIGNDIVIVYSFDIRNDSAFPVTVGKMRITVTRLGGGSEEFASHALDDVTIEPGASYPVPDRSITLETRPPPVGEVNLCLTYRAETCNEELPRGGNRCQIVEGF